MAPEELAKNFVPQLSAHKLRLLKKIFVDYQHSKDLLIQALENEITLFETYKLTMDDHASAFAKINKETISYQTCCSLFIDLLNNNWFVTLGLEGFQISKPNYSQTFGTENSSTEEVKDKMRSIQLVNRDKQVSSPETQRFIERMERPKVIGNEKKSVLDLIDNGNELSEIFDDISPLPEDKRISLLQKIIQPEIVVCYPELPLFQEEQRFCPYTDLKLSDIWRYFRLTWSSEYKTVPGKSFPMLIRNAARPNKPIIGIAMLRSAALGDDARDTMIGWKDEKTLREEIYAKKIDINFVVDSMLKCLDDQIKSVRTSDIKFLNSHLLKYPDQNTIDRLLDLYGEELDKRIKDLEFEKKEASKIDQFSETDWETESEKPLFRKKRAMKLARLLEIRKCFNEVNLKDNPARGYATLIHPSHKTGKDLLSRALKEIRLKTLAENIMDVSVCGAVAPYNELLGGKLVASLMGSQEVRDLFKSRYQGKYKTPSIIASSNKGEAIYRDANLMCLTTTSLYGVASSQYNRIKFLKKDFPELENDLVWKEIFKGKDSHKTKGMGVYHFSDRTSKLFSVLTRKKKGHVEVNNKFGEGTSPKLRKILLGIRELIDPKKTTMSSHYLFTHSIQRKNYIFLFEKNILNLLMNQNKTYNSIKASKASSITNAWIKRWLSNRVTRKQTLNKLKSLGVNSIKDSLFSNSPLLEDEKQMELKM